MERVGTIVPVEKNNVRKVERVPLKSHSSVILATDA
jgi:hypothetical protein